MHKIKNLFLFILEKNTNNSKIHKESRKMKIE